MSYVPGYQHDIFISYAHGDDRDWISRFVECLRQAIQKRCVRASIWIDSDNLRRNINFQREIPDRIRSSAVFLLLASPTYIRSQYCVLTECRVFQDTLVPKQTRFNTPDFANDQFAFRCPILPIDENEHEELFRGVTDIRFCNEVDTFSIGSPEFEASLWRLTRELITLLNRMRNHSTPVFLYPANPGPDLREVHKAVADELSAQSYRLLPDRLVNLDGQIREASLSVFLLGESYDETARELTEIAARQAKPWVVWCSPETEQRATAKQIGFCTYLEQLNSSMKTYLNSNIIHAKLKEEILALLRPNARVLPPVGGKPRVYLIYNWRDRAEKGNAGLIELHFCKEFQFEHPDDPVQHGSRLISSDGVILIWGNTDEDWCAREFEAMVQSSRHAQARGLCLFDPRKSKTAVVGQIRESLKDIYIAEEFGVFEPSRLDTFFNPLRRSAGTGQL
jgi:hypothetical protein